VAGRGYSIRERLELLIRHGPVADRISANSSRTIVVAFVSPLHRSCAKRVMGMIMCRQMHGDLCLKSYDILRGREAFHLLM
jgi:hypothetical protein